MRDCLPVTNEGLGGPATLFKDALRTRFLMKGQSEMTRRAIKTSRICARTRRANRASVIVEEERASRETVGHTDIGVL